MSHTLRWGILALCSSVLAITAGSCTDIQSLLQTLTGLLGSGA